MTGQARPTRASPRGRLDRQCAAVGSRDRLTGQACPRQLQFPREKTPRNGGRRFPHGRFAAAHDAGTTALTCGKERHPSDHRQREESDARERQTPLKDGSGCWVRREVLGAASTRIINEVRGVNRVAYDISSKPPATIEWE